MNSNCNKTAYENWLSIKWGFQSIIYTAQIFAFLKFIHYYYYFLSMGY